MKIKTKHPKGCRGKTKNKIYHTAESEKIMYYFKAKFYNVDDTEREWTIEIEGQFYENEYEIYVVAMRKAYNAKTADEILISVEFLAC